jgi:hypothetical protein
MIAMYFPGYFYFSQFFSRDSRCEITLKGVGERGVKLGNQMRYNLICYEQVMNEGCCNFFTNSLEFHTPTPGPTPTHYRTSSKQWQTKRPSMLCAAAHRRREDGGRLKEQNAEPEPQWISPLKWALDAPSQRRAESQLLISVNSSQWPSQMDE